MQSNERLTCDTFGSSDPIFRKEIGEYMTRQEQEDRRREFDHHARELIERRFAQSAGQALALRERFKRPVIGRITIVDALLQLGSCYDETDTELYCVSQLTHCLQVAASLEAAGVGDETLILAALIHDLGKIALLHGAAAEDVSGPTEPIGPNAKGCGLDNAVLMWNHDEFAYERLKGYVPDHVGWLTRFHSLRFERAGNLLDERDLKYLAIYLPIFRRHDLRSKSTFGVPKKTLTDYKVLLDKYFPEPIVI